MVTLLLLFAGLLLLYLGGEALVRGATALAARLGMPPLLIGLTVVAFGTSSPELAVSIDASISGHADIAIGNVVGSNICNVALILGACALLRPMGVEARVIRLDIPIMIGCSAMLAILLSDGALSRSEGALLFGLLVAYVYFSIRQARAEVEPVRQEFGALVLGRRSSMLVAIALVGVGLVMLAGGGGVFVDAAAELARRVGVSEAVVALTIVAAGTSMPELATSLVASARGQHDIAIGNVVGSNTFNVLGVLGLAAALSPLSGIAIQCADFVAMMVAAVLLLPLMYTQFRLVRWEGGLLLVSYIAYVSWLLMRS